MREDLVCARMGIQHACMDLVHACAVGPSACVQRSGVGIRAWGSGVGVGIQHARARQSEDQCRVCACMETRCVYTWGILRAMYFP